MDKEKLILELDEFEKNVLKRMEEYAVRNGYRLNPNEKLVKILIKGLVRNYRKYGELYCPCRRLSGDPKYDQLLICPCAFHKREINERGRCHCGLFVSKSYKK